MLEATLELGVGAAEGVLRVDAGQAGVVDEREEEVAELGLPLLLGCPGRRPVPELADLLLHFFPRPRRLGEVEADARRLLLHPVGAEQRRELARHALQDGRLPLGHLDLLPVLEHLAGAAHADVPEDVGVTSDELLRLGLDDVVQGERAVRLGDDAVEDDVQEDVAQLLLQLVRVAVVDGLDGLVGLLDEEVLYRCVGLLAVPRAVPPELPHDGDEVGVGFEAVRRLAELPFVDLLGARVCLGFAHGRGRCGGMGFARRPRQPERARIVFRRPPLKLRIFSPDGMKHGCHPGGLFSLPRLYSTSRCV